MRFNWGTKLMLVFVVFSALMSYLVYQCVKTKFDLVSKDYYQEELAYQEIIDGTKNARMLSTSLKLELADSVVNIVFPSELTHTHLAGKLWVYCPTDESKDRKMNFDLQPGMSLSIARSQIRTGNYIFKISWSDGSKKYFNEQDIRL